MTKLPCSRVGFLLAICGLFAASTFVVPLRLATAEPPTADRIISLPSDARHTLWIPGEFSPRGGKVDVLVDFHGSPQTVRKSCRAAGLNCVAVSVNCAGLSSVYRVPFAENRQLFGKILDEALSAVREQPDFPQDVVWGKLCVSSFSAGFGAVREILKSPEYFDRIDGICLVDSLYCGYVGDGTDAVQDGIVHPGLMRDFLRFAQSAAAGEKVMIVTHCCGPTPGYASTRETADYILEALNVEPETVDLTVPSSAEMRGHAGELVLYRQAERQGFALYGSPGPNETDHVRHLTHMAHWLPKLPLARRETAGHQR